MAPPWGLGDAQKDEDLILGDSGFFQGGLPSYRREASVPQAGLRRPGRVVLAAPGKEDLWRRPRGRAAAGHPRRAAL